MKQDRPARWEKEAPPAWGRAARSVEEDRAVFGEAGMITGVHAGWRWRLVAFAYDYALIAGFLCCVVAAGKLLYLVSPAAAGALFGDPVSGQLAGFLAVTLPVGLYFTLAESSTGQATWGKRKLDLRVTCLDGARLSVVRAAARTALKFLPWELAHACIWHLRASPQSPPSWATWGLALVWIMVGANLMCLWRGPAHQALHDRIAGTVVTRRQEAAPP